MHDLKQMIADARVELREASGLSLTPEGWPEQRHQLAVDELQAFVLRRLDIEVLGRLRMKVGWISGGPAAILKYEGHVFHLRRDGDDDCVLFKTEGQRETEIARIEKSDPHFTARVLVAIGDAAPPVPVGARPNSDALFEEAERSLDGLRHVIDDLDRQIDSGKIGDAAQRKETP
jgi:hypothetical protein